MWPIQWFVYISYQAANALEYDEKVISDSVYIDKKLISPNNSRSGFNDVNQRIRARLEIFNGRLKNFRVSQYQYRHSIQEQKFDSYAVLNLPNLMTLNLDPLFLLQGSILILGLLCNKNINVSRKINTDLIYCTFCIWFPHGRCLSSCTAFLLFFSQGQIMLIE